jgi:hypothetical protein
VIIKLFAAAGATAAPQPARIEMALRCSPVISILWILGGKYLMLIIQK